MDILLTPGGFRNALRLTAINGDSEQFAMDNHGGAAVRRGKMEAFRFVGYCHQFGVVFLRIALDVDGDFGALARCQIQLPEAEVVFVHDGLAVA